MACMLLQLHSRTKFVTYLRTSMCENGFPSRFPGKKGTPLLNHYICELQVQSCSKKLVKALYIRVSAKIYS